jgi:hypothetical protein
MLTNIASSALANNKAKYRDGSPVVRSEQHAIIGPEVYHVGESVVVVSRRSFLPLRTPPSLSQSIKQLRQSAKGWLQPFTEHRPPRRVGPT